MALWLCAPRDSLLTACVQSLKPEIVPVPLSPGNWGSSDMENQRTYSKPLLQMLPAVPHGNTVYLLYVPFKALVDPQNQRTPLEMTKLLLPFETSRIPGWSWSASSLLPVFCFLTGSLTGSLTGLVHNDSVTIIYVIIVHMSSHSVWHVLNCSGWNWRKLLIIHSSGLKPMDSKVPFWYHWQGISQWSKTTCQPFQHSEAPPSLVSQNLLSIVNDILKSLKVWQSCFRPPPNITASGPYPDLNQSIYHLYHLDISKPF